MKEYAYGLINVAETKGSSGGDISLLYVQLNIKSIYLFILEKNHKF